MQSADEETVTPLRSLSQHLKQQSLYSDLHVWAANVA